MSKPDAWMPFYPGDYLADTRRLSLEHHGAYLLLILDYWRNGPPPHDEQTLARIVGSTVSVWRRLSPVILPLFKVVDGFLRHKRIDAELEVATERKGKAIAKAAKAAAARWSEHATSNAPSIPQAVLKECPSPSPSPIRSKTTPTRAAPAGVRQEVWDAWQRTRGKKLTADAITLQSKQLAEFAAAGDDPNDVIEQSIRNTWAGLFRLNRPRQPSKQDARATIAAGHFKGQTSEQPTDITGQSERVA